MRRLFKDAVGRKQINLQLIGFHYARGMENAKDYRKDMFPGEWYKMFEDGTLKLKKFVIQVLAL